MGVVLVVKLSEEILCLHVEFPSWPCPHWIVHILEIGDFQMMEIEVKKSGNFDDS